MKRILYLAAGNPASPSSGMDIVARSHFDELCAIPDVRLSAVFSAPRRKLGAPGPDCAQWRGGQIYFGAVPSEPARSQRLIRLFIEIMQFRFVQYRDFRSRAAVDAIRSAVDQKYDCVILDHFISLTNISVIQLIRCALDRHTRIIFIAHNVTPRSMIDTARLTRSLSAKAIFSLQAAQAFLLELILFRIADMTVFISSYDYSSYGRLAGRRSMSLFPLRMPEEHGAPTFTSAPPNPYLVFVGSPTFAPNRFAIEWICSEFAPRLMERAPALSIVLVGQSTDTLSFKAPDNVTAVGFVKEAAIAETLRKSSGLLCPVIHGSGIKIKIMDAILAGCPILATGVALRGFEFMGITPKVFVDDPDRTVDSIVTSISDDAVSEARGQIVERWSRHMSVRRGRLAQVLNEIAAPPRRSLAILQGIRE